MAKFYSGWIHQWRKHKCREKIGGYCHYNQSALGQLNKTANSSDWLVCIWCGYLILDSIALRLWIRDASSKSGDKVGLHLTLNLQPKATLRSIQFGIFLCCQNFFLGFFPSVFCFFEARSTSESNNSIEQGGLDCKSDKSTTWSRFVDSRMTPSRSIMELVPLKDFWWFKARIRVLQNLLCNISLKRRTSYKSWRRRPSCSKRRFWTTRTKGWKWDQLDTKSSYHSCNHNFAHKCKKVESKHFQSLSNHHVAQQWVYNLLYTKFERLSYNKSKQNAPSQFTSHWLAKINK